MEEKGEEGKGKEDNKDGGVKCWKSGKRKSGKEDK